MSFHYFGFLLCHPSSPAWCSQHCKKETNMKATCSEDWLFCWCSTTITVTFVLSWKGRMQNGMIGISSPLREGQSSHLWSSSPRKIHSPVPALHCIDRNYKNCKKIKHLLQPDLMISFGCDTPWKKCTICDLLRKASNAEEIRGVSHLVWRMLLLVIIFF